MTLILFLSLGISNKSIPSLRFDKRIMQRALCCQSQNLDMEGESFDWVILVSFLPDQQSSLGKVKNQHYARFTHALAASAEVGLLEPSVCTLDCTAVREGKPNKQQVTFENVTVKWTPTCNPVFIVYILAKRKGKRSYNKFEPQSLNIFFKLFLLNYLNVIFSW